MDHTFIKNRDIVMFSFQSWDTEIGSNFKDMAMELSKLNRVLFVNRALDRISLIRNKATPQVASRLASIKNGTNEFVAISPSLWIQNPRTIVESINWIPFSWIHDSLNLVNNKRLAKEINKATRQLGFSNVILLNDNDFIRGRYLKKLVNCTDYIFYKRDYMLGVGYFERHGPRLVEGTLREADLVVTNSAYLKKLAEKFNPNAFDIGQGCNPGNFTSVDGFVPEDIFVIKKPIIGYTGFISAWRIDIEVIAYIAQKLPDCSLVLIGPIDKLFQVNELKQLENIHFLGYKPPAELPVYMKQFDVCINPQALNEVTRGNYPRKIDEYLAMGKPVVATETEAMKMFEPFTWLCNTKMDFVEKISNILKDPGKHFSAEEKDRRIAFSLKHSWFNSIGKLGDAYYATKNKLANKVASQTVARKKNWLEQLAIYFLAAYLLFIYIKFLFY